MAVVVTDDRNNHNWIVTVIGIVLIIGAFFYGFTKGVDKGISLWKPKYEAVKAEIAAAGDSLAAVVANREAEVLELNGVIDSLEELRERAMQNVSKVKGDWHKLEVITDRNELVKSLEKTANTPVPIDND